MHDKSNEQEQASGESSRSKRRAGALDTSTRRQVPGMSWRDLGAKRGLVGAVTGRGPLRPHLLLSRVTGSTASAHLTSEQLGRASSLSRMKIQSHDRMRWLRLRPCAAIYSNRRLRFVCRKVEPYRDY